MSVRLAWLGDEGRHQTAGPALRAFFGISRVPATYMPAPGHVPQRDDAIKSAIEEFNVQGYDMSAVVTNLAGNDMQRCGQSVAGQGGAGAPALSHQLTRFQKRCCNTSAACMPRGCHLVS